MTFRQFAFNNVFRNKRTYAAYFLSSMFSVLVFFVYAIFAFHPALKNINAEVAIGLHFAEGIIYVFSFIFVLVSMSAFLKSRKKEFGLMVMHGMTNMQLRKMVFLENVFIGFFATVFGMLIGVVFSKMILLAAENVLNLDEVLPFYWPVSAIVLTFVAFLFLFIVISFFTVSVLKGNKLVDLIKGSAAPKKEPKASIALSLLAIFLLGIGYAGALIARNLQVVIAMIPVTTVVIIGTYFLFTQLSVFLINRLKKNKSFFLRKTNIVVMSDLAYRMKDNARAFFFVAIVSTVAFSAIGALVGFRTMMTADLLKNNPFAFEYTSREDNHLETKHIQLIRDELENLRYKEVRTDIKRVLSTSDSYNVTSESGYNHLLAMVGEEAEQVNLKENEAILLFYESAIDGTSRPIQHEKITFGNLVLEQEKAIPTNVFPAYRNFLVVSDEVFDQMKTYEWKQTYYAFYMKDWKQSAEAGKKLSSKIGEFDREGKHEFFSLAYSWHEINQAFGAVLFIGLFIGAVFFISAGSFLYFRLYADFEDEKRKFSAIRKLGLTDKELSKIITIQLSLLFFVPIIVALIHGAVALTALEHMFNYSLVKESTLVLSSFAGIQIIYFLFIRSNYIRKIRRSI
ncbi:FtsX-like permease family protein [Lederbergia wuyishanensis]|uniref:ABC transport system permease protein n=1 Tax=Lederbergia wuyishanensis TaxID=1347903 RepID=A0ABU0DB08_9BACI|nr:ABC transporter permease [Lederbergia wuyishanensis]MCJ8010061.1 ABC transporter permease [Lederbergia wuyishanensis]MDQ0345575.1 putative ABC transport system permease protein [Lederbergia wuyishanensis]